MTNEIKVERYQAGDQRFLVGSADMRTAYADSR